MGWVKLSDDFVQHPKVTEVGVNGLALFIAGLCYCNRYLTDGKIPASAVPTLIDFTDAAYNETQGHLDSATFAASVADVLVSIGLWHRAGKGFRVHDYDQYQPSKAKVLADRERDKARKPRREAPFGGSNVTALDHGGSR